MQGTRGGTRWKPRCDLALCSCSTDRAAHGTDDGQPQWLLRAGEHRAWCSETQPLAMPLLPACAQPRREVVAVAATTLNGSSQGRRRASTRLRPTSDDRRGKRLALVQREHDLRVGQRGAIVREAEEPMENRGSRTWSPPRAWHGNGRS